MEGTVAEEERREVQPAAQETRVREGMQPEGAGQLPGAAEGQPAAEEPQGNSPGGSQGPSQPSGTGLGLAAQHTADEGQAAAPVQQAVGEKADQQPESPAGVALVAGEAMEVDQGTTSPAMATEAADEEAGPAAEAAAATAGPPATVDAKPGTDLGQPPETQAADILADQGAAVVEAPALSAEGAAGQRGVPQKDGEKPQGIEVKAEAADRDTVTIDAAAQPSVDAVPGLPDKVEPGSGEAGAGKAAKAAAHAGGPTAEQMPVEATAAAEAAVAAAAAEAACDVPREQRPQSGGEAASRGPAERPTEGGVGNGTEEAGDVPPSGAPAAAASLELDDAGGSAVAATAPAPHAPAPPAPIIPGIPEEQHPLKPQWRRGRVGPTTEFLMVTVTQGDVNSRRMRPPRHWYDSLMGGAFGVFEVEADVDGAQTKFYPQAHAYEYCKSEYYVQGSECKRLYKELNLQPGDGLVFRKGEMLATGVPSTKLTVMRVADNPHAAAILNSAASAQIRRAAAQADPNRRKTPKKKAGAPGGGTGSAAAGSGASRKRKMAPVRAATDGMPSSFTPDSDAPQASRARRTVRNRRFPYGEDFVTGGGQKQFWDLGAAAAAAAEEDEEDREEGSEGLEGGFPGGSRDIEMGDASEEEDAAISDDSHGRGGAGGGSSPSRHSRLLAASGAGAAARPPPKSPLLAVAAAAHVHEQQRQQLHEPRPSPEKPRVTAMNIEGRNVLRIRLPFKRPAGQAGTGAQGTPSAAGKAAGPQQAQQGGGPAAGAAVVGAAAVAGPKAGGPGAVKSPKPRPAAAAGAKDARAMAAAVRSPPARPAGPAEDALDSLVALAAAAEDGIETGGKPEKRSGGSAAAAAPRGDVTLLSKSLTRDGDGQVTGANLKLSWDKERIAFSAITHHISEYGATHHDLATVEDFEVQPAEGQLRVTLRVAQAGRVDLLEKAVQQLVAML